MKITVKAKPWAREQKIEKVDEQNFVVSVIEPPVDGRANAAIVKVLAGYFRVPLFKIRLISGYASRHKVFEINTV